MKKYFTRHNVSMVFIISVLVVHACAAVIAASYWLSAYHGGV